MQDAGVLPAEGHCQRPAHILNSNAGERGLFPVDCKSHLLLIVLAVHVHIHHANGFCHDCFDLRGNAEAAGVIRTVDFGHQSSQHRRTGRYFSHFYPGAVLVGNALYQRTNPLGNGMRLVLPLFLPQEINLDISQIAPFAQVVVPHQAVEVERGTGADIHLEIGHFGHSPQGVTHCAGDAGGLFQRSSIRSIDDHLQLVLVVEGEHLDRHGLEEDQRAGEQQQDHNPGQEAVAQLFLMNKPPHPFPVKGGEFRIFRRFVRAMMRLPLHETIGKVWGDDEGDQHGEKHRHARPDRDRPHIGTHEAADEAHGENRGDDGKGGQNGRVADLVHRLYRRLQRFHDGCGEVAVDILHDHDGIVDQDADREDQGEQGNAVQRIADQVKDQHGQGQRDRYGDGRHCPGAPPHEYGYQDGDRDGGQEHMKEQFVVLLLGGLAVIAGHGNLYI